MSFRASEVGRSSSLGSIVWAVCDKGSPKRPKRTMTFASTSHRDSKHIEIKVFEEYNLRLYIYMLEIYNVWADT